MYSETDFFLCYFEHTCSNLELIKDLVLTHYFLFDISKPPPSLSVLVLYECIMEPAQLGPDLRQLSFCNRQEPHPEGGPPQTFKYFFMHCRMKYNGQGK